MRICHVSDSHLGAGENHPQRGPSGLTLRQEDIIRAYERAVDRIIEIGPDVCIHSGDLFHTVRPTNRIMALAGEQLYRLAEGAGIPTVIIAGNHDMPKQPHIGAALEVFSHLDNLHIAAGSKLEIFDIKGSRFYALPHCLTSAILKEQLELCRRSGEASHHVMIAHGVAAGMPEFSMADLGEQEISRDVFDRFDYTAMGHFHNYCRVADRAFYAGSTERLSQTERTAAKGFAVVDLDPFAVGFEEIECRQMIDLEKIDVSGKRGDEVAAILKEEMTRLGSEDKIVRVSLTGVTEETLKTIPIAEISSLKRDAFALDIRFEKAESETETRQFGRSAIGQLDKAFVEFLQETDLKGFDRERLVAEALKYLGPEG